MRSQRVMADFWNEFEILAPEQSKNNNFYEKILNLTTFIGSLWTKKPPILEAFWLRLATWYCIYSRRTLPDMDESSIG